MNDIDRNDLAFIKVAKEHRRLTDQHRKAQRLLAHVEGTRGAFSNVKPQAGLARAYMPLDFNLEHDPVLVAFQPAFEIIADNFSALLQLVDQLEVRINDANKLIQAYHDGKDVVMAKLAMERGQ